MTAPDERTETVARDGLVDVAYRAWCDARKGKPGAPGEYEALYSRIEAGWMAQVVAAVVAALDDLPRTALRRLWEERQEARAALDRVRALHVRMESPSETYYGPDECSCGRDWRTCETRAALDPEEPR